MKHFLLFSASIALLGVAIVEGLPWLGALGLLIAFIALWTDKDPVVLDSRERHHETTKDVREMRRRKS